MSANKPPHLAAINTSNFAFSSESAITFTAARQASNAETLEELYSGLGLSPPANANEILISDIKNTVNKHLQLIGKTWLDLDEHQQAKISFLVLRDQPSLLQKSGYDVAVSLWNALDVNTHFGRRLEDFVEKGGDLTLEENYVALPPPRMAT
jgi:hypothetical protein